MISQRHWIRPALWALCAAAVLGGCSPGHRPPPPSTDIDENRYRNALRVLASDGFEGRRPGTPGEEKTLAYLVSQFRGLGLKPGNGDSFLQQVPLVEMQTGADAKLAVTGRGSVRALHYGTDMVIWTGRAAPNANLAQSELVFAGYGIVAPEYGWDDYAGADVRGKTVLLLANDPGYGSKDPAIFKGLAATRYARWAYKIEEATRQGAAGVLLIHDSAALGFGWNVVVSSWMGPQFEQPAPAGSTPRIAVEGWLSSDAAAGLFKQAGIDAGALTKAASKKGFKVVDTGLKVDADLTNTVRAVNSSNLIALLPGGDRRHEYVVYSAHWDHLGKDGTGAVYDGAVDNASGVAGLLTIAQSFARTRPPPDRSIVFIAFTGGEWGQLGSAYYVANPAFPLRDTAGELNLDGMHIGGRTRDLMLYGAGNSELEELVRGAALLQGREMRPEIHPELGLFFRSDQFNFAEHGVPVVYAKAGIDDAARGPVWGQAQMDDYMAHRYRQTSDRYSEDWVVSGALEDLSLYYEVGYRLALTRRFPRWYPSSEFSASHRHPGEE